MTGEIIDNKDLEIKLEENLINVYKDSRKSSKQLSKIRIVLLTIISIIILLGGMFVIDVYQMRNNKPVVFSTWGFKYYPVIDIHELEKATKDFIYEEQENQIVKRELVNAKGLVELNTFLIEENKDQTEYTVSCWMLEEIFCEKDGEIVQECGLLNCI